MNLIKGPKECLEVIQLLTDKFTDIKLQQEADIALLNSCGQVAVECVEKNVKLANKWLQEWVDEEISSSQTPEASSKRQSIRFYDFLALCEIFMDAAPEIADELIALESVFIPFGPQLLPPVQKSNPKAQSNKKSKS